MDEAAAVEASTTQSLPFYRLDEHAQFLQDVAQLNGQKVMLEVRETWECRATYWESGDWEKTLDLHYECPMSQKQPYLMQSTHSGLKWSKVELRIENFFEYPAEERGKCVVKGSQDFKVLRLMLSVELEEIQELGGTTSLLIHSRAK